MSLSKTVLGQVQHWKLNIKYTHLCASELTGSCNWSSVSRGFFSVGFDGLGQSRRKTLRPRVSERDCRKEWAFKTEHIEPGCSISRLLFNKLPEHKTMEEESSVLPLLPLLAEDILEPFIKFLKGQKKKPPHNSQQQIIQRFTKTISKTDKVKLLCDVIP